MKKASPPSPSRIVPLGLACFFAVCFPGLLPQADAALSAADTSPYAWTTATLDVDALAVRPKSYQALYPKIRDEALAAYAQAHPDSHPYDDDVKKLIRLMTYLFLWGDPYGEGLWNLARQETQQARSEGADDLILDFMTDLNGGVARNDSSADSLNHRAEAFAVTAYPDVFKGWYYHNILMKLARARAASDSSDATNASDSAWPETMKKWGALYEHQIKAALPNSLLFCIGSGLEADLKDDAYTLTLAHDELDRAFAAAAPDSAVRLALEGDYLTNEAWLARTSGWANSVTDQQWAQFSDYLGKADTVLEAAYAKHPDEAEISVLMLKVELGQGQGRDRMDRWFQRAIAADPQDADAYAAKFWYLQPRWYGSDGDLVSFGQECLDRPDTPPGAMTAFAVAISDASDGDRGIYRRPDVWPVVEKNYRQFLSQYPQSIFYRTSFAKHAVESERWAIAKEQLDLLGDSWDRTVLSESEHTRDVELAGSPAPPETQPPAETEDSQPESLLSSLWKLIVFIVRLFV